jgi:cyclopropane fatty-acyl-phospholipid synthase-like methyltransferase
MVLDLGCDKGLTSVLFTKDFKQNVIAVDLWIETTLNKQTFNEVGLPQNLLISIKTDVLSLPFANGYFEAAICVGAYHYFGCNNYYLDQGKSIFLILRKWKLLQ